MEAYPNLKPWRPGQSGNLNLPCPVPIGRAHCRGRLPSRTKTICSGTKPTILPYGSKDFPLIPQQDYSNIPIQQIGMHSEGFEFMRLASKVEGLVSNYQQLIDGYIAGAPSARLARASATLGASFDGKIADLGF